MTIQVSVVLDATHANIAAIPRGILAALYTTGSPDIRATSQDFINHPRAIRICQDNGSDDTADIIDSEQFAATPQDVVNWLPKARASFNSVKRPGQRWPGVYASLNNLPPIANLMVAAKLTNVPLWVAEWGLAEASALADITLDQQPWPIVGMQIKNQVTTDFSIFSNAWLDTVSMVHGFPLNQDGIVHSLTTNRNGKVVTNDGGKVWAYAGV